MCEVFFLNYQSETSVIILSRKKKKAKKSIYEYFSYLFKTQPNFSECLTISTLNKARFSMYINIYTNPPGVYRLSVYFTK